MANIKFRNHVIIINTTAKQHMADILKASQPRDSMAHLLDRALVRVSSLGVPATSGLNVVAFSGGVDSSLVAKLVHTVFPQNSVACTGNLLRYHF